MWHRQGWKRTGGWDDTYHGKVGAPEQLGWNQAINVDFHDEEPQELDEKRKAIYVRSAYRNDPEFQIGSLPRTTSALVEERIDRLIDNDASCARAWAGLGPGASPFPVLLPIKLLIDFFQPHQH